MCYFSSHRRHRRKVEGVADAHIANNGVDVVGPEPERDLVVVDADLLYSFPDNIVAPWR